MNKNRSMPWALALLLAFLPPGTTMEERMMSVTMKTGSSAVITCDIDRDDLYLDWTHWYRIQEDKSPQHLLYYDPSLSRVVSSSGFSERKYSASRGTKKAWNLKLMNVEESDSGVYYCAVWVLFNEKVFGGGTKLSVIDKNFDADISPKPTIFLPSVDETNLYKAGTYVCLLGKFFPDVIKVYWKDTDNKILESQEGDTMKTNDTYMKVSWLTVTGQSMTREHRCIVEHENNKNEVNQEIIFPPIKKVATSTDPTDYQKDKNDVLQLQITSTSAYYTYLLLLLKSATHLAIISFICFRRRAACGKTS